MKKQALSVTLDQSNITWLKGRAGVTGGSVSRLLDQIVSSARQGVPAGPARSVVGTIDIDASDPLLERADEVVRAAFDASLGRPLAAKERRASYSRRNRISRRRRG
jgi:hypothetical protein